MRLVAQPLNEVEHGVARLELERLAAGQEKGLRPGVAVGPLATAISGTSAMPSAASVSCAA